MDTCVSRVPIFRGLSPEQQLEVARFARPVKASAGDQVMAAGERSPRLYVIHSGQLRVVQLLGNGSEHVLRLLGPGEVLGEESFVLGRRPSHYAYAEAEAQLCTFRHADLAGLVSKFPDIAMKMLQVQSERLASAELRLAAMSGADVQSRLAAYLLDLPSKVEAGEVLVELPMAKKDLASHLGTKPETLSRRLRELSDRGILELRGRRGIVLRDVDALLAGASIQG